MAFYKCEKCGFEADDEFRFAGHGNCTEMVRKATINPAHRGHV